MEKCMKDNEKIPLPRMKVLPWFITICFAAIAALAYNDSGGKIALALIWLACWLFIYSFTCCRFWVSAEGFEIRVFGIPVRRVSVDRIARIEVILGNQITFELDNCPRFKGDPKGVFGDKNMFSVYIFRHLIKAVQYIPPYNKVDEAVELLRKLYPCDVRVVPRSRR